MGRLHEIRIRSEAFVNSMDLHIENSIKAVEPELLRMNKGQMLSSKDAENKPLIHKRTGRPTLSYYYARRKGKQTPNLYDTGKFQSEMFLNVHNQDWFIDSYANVSKYLVENYGKIFGIFDKVKAKDLTGAQFKRFYNRLVLGK